MTTLKAELESLRIDRQRRASRSWPRLLIVGAVGLAAVSARYGWKVRAARTSLEVETVRASLSRDEAGGGALLTASGYVVARRKAVVSAKIQGRLAWLAVEEGSQVAQGQVLARLESAEQEAQVLRAQAQVQQAETDLGESRRQLRLVTDLNLEGVVSEDQLAADRSRVRLAEAARAQAEADLAFARAGLQNTVVRAPFAGVVVRKMAEVGESVAPIPPGVNLSTSSGAIVALADLATLEVEADVGESNVAKLGPGQPAEVTVEAFPERRLAAVLRQIIPTADRTKATVQVKVTIVDRDPDLKPEMSARVTFHEACPRRASVAPVVMVPEDALATRDGRPTVFEVREGRARARTVVLGGDRRGQVVVEKGLAGGETLVARPPETLKEGDAVSVRQ